MLKFDVHAVTNVDVGTKCEKAFTLLFGQIKSYVNDVKI